MKTRVHHCIAQEKVVYGLIEPSPDIKCACRKFISLRRATKLVNDGEASWITISRVRGQRPIPCRLCLGDKDVKNCSLCSGKGVTDEPYVQDTPGSDILLISRSSYDPNDKKKNYWLKQKTPRTATIEAGHIERALDFPEASERVEDYGWMILLVLHEMGAELMRCQPGKSAVTLEGYKGKLEPEDNQKKWEGRTYDFGRPI